MCMGVERKTILLDQNDWVGIARAKYKPKKADENDEALRDVVEALRSEGHSFPLSVGRYIETIKMQNVKRRREVAMAMLSLSNNQTLLRTDLLTQLEITRFLGVRRGDPAPTPITPIGQGASHALGISGFSVISGPNVDLVELGEQQELVDALLPEWTDIFEFQVLAGETLDDGELETRLTKLSTDFEQFRQSFVTDENAAQELVRSNAPRDFDRVIRGQTAFEALDSRGNEGLLALQGDQEFEVLRELPTVDVLAELRAQKGRDQGNLWKGNDYVDVITLQQGVPYCDVVSADKNWASLANSAGLGQRYDTNIVGKPSDLVSVLQAIQDGS